MVRALDKLPIYFEANQGQTDPQVSFLARGQGYNLFLTPAEVTLVLHQQAQETEESGTGAALRMSLVGAETNPRLTGQHELPGRNNYFIGNEPANWYSDIPTFEQVRYSQVYPGIDLVLYGNQQSLEYDFRVEPGADPGQILMNYAGAQSLELDEAGDLIIRLPGGEVRQKAPVIYQETYGVRHQIEGGFVISGQRVKFRIGQYDATQPLIIDPLLVYSSFLGGSGSDGVYKVALNSSGEAFIVGATYSADFPSTAGAYDTSFNGGTTDVYVAKLTATGTALLFSTFIGGSGDDSGYNLYLKTFTNTGNGPGLY
ncbi:MAG: hypothetical protein DPW09_26235, partial [Anaerolineae bacterium]|nr:hypothetical protein [Anaerolineae bacterium]